MMEEEDAKSDISTEEMEATNSVKTVPKRTKPGIIYLSSVPDFMRIQKLRQIFEEYGEVRRTYFEPVEKSFKYKKGLLFKEGWVEFGKRRDAKLVAAHLNNTSVGGKKRHPWYSCIWNIKYLPKFTWTDVNGDKELKRRIHESRIRTETSQAKKQTAFYATNMERGETLAKINNKRAMKGKEKPFQQLVHVQQRLTDEEFLARKKSQREQKGDRPGEKRKSNYLEENKKSHKFVMSNIFGAS